MPDQPKQADGFEITTGGWAEMSDVNKRALARVILLALASTALAACGGGSTGGETPNLAPAAPKAPEPVQPQAPEPQARVAVTNYNTPEYQRSTSLARIQALPAYEGGATGAGVTIGVIDSGIDNSSGEFSGRIHPLSKDVAGTRALNDPQGHGTLVSAVAAGGRNDAGTFGVAFDATVLVARADNGDSCATSGCSYLDDDIARGVDLAVSGGARVVNISLGGSPASGRLLTAVQRATSAGVIIVVSAGNDSGSQPDALARSLLSGSISNGLVLVAGSLAPNNSLSSFSNAAGASTDRFISAPGEQVPTTGLSGRQLSVNGTSFAAPQVAGALAVLADAYPTLSSAQLVDLLLSSAVDLGATGADSVFGRGALNIANAFKPQGATRLASGAPVSLSGPEVVLGGALGSGVQLGSALKDLVILDRFDRPFTVDLGPNVRAVTARLDLAERLQRRATYEQRALSDRAHLALTLAEAREARIWRRLGLSDVIGPRKKPLGGQASLAISERASVAAGVGVSPYALVEGARAPSQGVNFIADADRDPFTPSGANGSLSFAATSLFGNKARAFRVTASASSGAANRQEQPYEWARRQATPKVSRAIVRVASTLPWIETGVSLGAGRETGSLLGATAAASFALPHTSMNGTAGLDATVRLGGGWRLALAGELGVVRPGAASDLSIITGATRLTTSRFSAGLLGGSVLKPGDRFGLRVSQPLRVETGGVTLTVPVGYDAARGIAVLEDRRASLTPTGREIAVEAAYMRPLGRYGVLETSLFRRQDPGHSAGTTADTGAIVAWSTSF